MKKWEYRVRFFLEEDELNKLGEEGWELITISFKEYNPRGYCFYFKREIIKPSF